MAQFKYEILSADEQKSLIEQRLVGLERDHLNVSLDLSASGDGGNPPAEERLAKLTEVITGLRARLKNL